MLVLLAIVSLLQVLLAAFLVAGTFRKPRIQAAGQAPISVIIALRNEQENLLVNLDSWVTQDFAGEWELVLVLDRCTDASAGIVKGFAQKFPRIKVVEISETALGWAPKKFALQQGIRQAKHGRLAFTDADCHLEAGWLRGMDQAFSAGAELVLGVGPLKRKPGVLNALARFETWMTAIMYTGLAGWGHAYMGVGRSMGYTRALWEKAGGFEGHKDRLSGDDDLLVNAVGKSARIQVLNEKGSRAYSDAPGTWPDWISQKLRHHSAAPAYSFSSQLILVCVHGLHAIFYLSLVLAFLCSDQPGWVAVVAGCRFLASTSLWAFTSWPDRSDLLLWAPLLDFCYLLYIIVIGPVGMILPPKWKGK